jgi:uncharacterized protein YijF (DUF1287 family)
MNDKKVCAGAASLPVQSASNTVKRMAQQAVFFIADALVYDGCYYQLRYSTFPAY